MSNLCAGTFRPLSRHKVTTMRYPTVDQEWGGLAVIYEHWAPPFFLFNFYSPFPGPLSMPPTPL